MKCSHFRLIVGALQYLRPGLSRQLAISRIAEAQRSKGRNYKAGIALRRMAFITPGHVRSRRNVTETDATLLKLIGQNWRGPGINLGQLRGKNRIGSQVDNERVDFADDGAVLNVQR